MGAKLARDGILETAIAGKPCSHRFSIATVEQRVPLPITTANADSTTPATPPASPAWQPDQPQRTTQATRRPGQQELAHNGILWEQSLLAMASLRPPSRASLAPTRFSIATGNRVFLCPLQRQMPTQQRPQRRRLHRLGNLISRSEQLKLLGARASKSLPTMESCGSKACSRWHP